MRVSRALSFLVLLCVISPAVHLYAAPRTIVSKPCPYSCSIAGLKQSVCRDWRRGNTCYVQDLRSPQTSPDSPLLLCASANGNSILTRKRCRSDLGERVLDLAMFKGEKGNTGETGEQGPTGATGADGALRIYGDGSSGSRSITSSILLNDTNPQYRDFIVASGVTMQVPSGTVIRCTGEFRNEGTIQVLPALREHPRFGDTGQRLMTANSGGLEAPGGSGGRALAAGAAKSLLRLGLIGGGHGYREPESSGGEGGGNFTVLCRGDILNSGSITADGSSAGAAAQGGGGGGFVVLASASLVTNSGVIQARGAAGGSLRPTDPNSTGYGPGGGGGGGIVHLISPQAGALGTITVSGGAGGAAGGAGAITGLVYIGGGGGGGAGGVGGDGGKVNSGNAGNDSTASGENGQVGQVIQTTADPAAFF